MGILDDLRVENGSLENETKAWKIFDLLIHDRGYEYLRSVQKDFLETWYKRRNEKDLIGVLSTGTGKTLIGLLALQSQLNSGKGPCMYLCPTKQLVQQVIDEAGHHGINVTQFAGDNTQQDSDEIPFDFKAGNSILVTTFDKLFNGKSKFGVNRANYMEIGSIVVDDAHTAIMRAKQSSTISISKDKYFDEYNGILQLYLPYLKKQSNAKVQSIVSGNSNAAMKVPYWAIIRNKSTLLNILKNMVSSNKIVFEYPFVFEQMDNLEVFIDRNTIDIRPIYVPVEMIPSFYNANHRLFLSATVSNKADFITQFGVSKNCVQNPIEIDGSDDSGEKLLITPQRINPKLNDDIMRQIIVKWFKKGEIKSNIVVIVPSSNAAEPWKKLGATVYSRDSIQELLNDLNGDNYKIAVLINRYDGIDLAGDMCHFLILDGMPSNTDLAEKATAQREPNSIRVNGQIARTIEQGIGRTVRSGGDNSVIFLLGSSLQDFMILPQNEQFFTLRTQAQLKFSKKILSNFKDYQDSELIQNILEIIKYSLNRNLKWEQTYQDNVTNNYQSLISAGAKKENIDKYQVERQAWGHAREGEYVEAATILRNALSDKLSGSDGITYEKIAMYQYHYDQVASLDSQKKLTN